jgi:hypothetical protein
MVNKKNKENEYHSENVSRMMSELRDHLRSDIDKIEDEQLKAVFETSAEVLGGLMKTISDYQKKSEKAWQD